MPGMTILWKPAQLTVKHELPPVLYNDVRPWTAAEKVAELIEVVPGLIAYSGPDQDTCKM